MIGPFVDLKLSFVNYLKAAEKIVAFSGTKNAFARVIGSYSVFGFDVENQYWTVGKLNGLFNLNIP